LSSDRSHSAVDPASQAVGTSGRPRRSGAGGAADDGSRGKSFEPRVAVAIALIVLGLFWAIARGLEFYGLTPARIYYDLDQPPLLLVLVGIWLVLRRRSR
jgi:hypothetical protein